MKAPIKLSDLHDEINALGGVATTEFDKGYCDAVGHALAIVERLDARPFNVLDHLRNGERVWSDEKQDYAICNCGGHPEWSKGHGIGVRVYDLLNHSWQPYTPPPAEGSLDWAKQLDCKVCHVSFDNPGAWVDFSKGTNTMMLDNETAWKIENYAVGWSTYQAPRKPGHFYWGHDEDGGKQPVEALTNGKLLLLGNPDSVGESYFVFVGDEIVASENSDGATS